MMKAQHQRGVALAASRGVLMVAVWAAGSAALPARGPVRSADSLVRARVFAGVERADMAVRAPLFAQASGTASASTPSNAYGKELPIVGTLGSGPAMDVALRANRIFVIGQGKLHVADASDPARPRVVGSTSGLGNTRQLVVAGEVAYVSSRADGLFVVSVKEPAAPKLLCHYDTIEWATGLALSGDVLFVACRNFGVELVNVSDPAKPVHLSSVRTGEAQSVVARNGWLYAGVWGTSEVVIVDARNPRQPRIVARAPLDGYGDGVDVRGKFLYAATGHHSRQPHRNEDDPGFGHGHGLEIFDISDPARLRFVSRVKFPKLYQIGNDMWGVTVSGNHAFVADTHNGVFIVDVSDARKPVVIAHRQLPVIESRKQRDFVGGLALVQDHIYAAGGWSDLHVIAAPGLACPPGKEADGPPVIPPMTEARDARYRAYRPEGQVHAVALADDIAVAACGNAGIHVVRLWPVIERLAVQATEDFATDVAMLGDRVFVAEGAGGLSIWKLSVRGQLALQGRYRVANQRVRHVTAPAPGRYALVQVGESRLHIVDVSDPGGPKLALQDTRFGLLYGHQIMDGLVDHRYAAVFWHVSGLHWYDLGGAKPVYAGQNQPGRFNPQDGMMAVGDRVLVTRNGGYVLFNRTDQRPLDEMQTIKLHRVRGKPTLLGRRLCITDRATGEVNHLDVSDISKPKLVQSFVTPGNPGRIVAATKGFVIPDGYNGLLVYDQPQLNPP